MFFAITRFQRKAATRVDRDSAERVFRNLPRQPVPLLQPAAHVTIGSMLHTIGDSPNGRSSLEINPQLLYTDGATGLGGHGLMNVGVKVGTTSLTGGAFIFWDGLRSTCNGGSEDGSASRSPVEATGALGVCQSALPVGRLRQPITRNLQPAISGMRGKPTSASTSRLMAA